jgi:outer membrane protein OmpA-like peptidoglycan-associated protein
MKSARHAFAISSARVHLAVMLSMVFACSGVRATSPLRVDAEVWFSENSSRLEPNAVVELNRLVCRLQGSKVVTLMLWAHAAKGELQPENLALGRALAVRAFVLASPSAIEHIAIQNRSDQLPVKTNSTEAGRASNRRVEIEPVFARWPP